MPSLQVTCPLCQAIATVDDSQAGSAATCGNCRGAFQIPYPPAAGVGSPFQAGVGMPSDVRDFTSKKVAAGICGIMFGTFGVHKFILGFNGAGAIMLSVSLACLFTGPCLLGIPFFGSLAMHIIGLVEGIIYLTKSDAEFYQLYAIQRKEWF